ncbi:MAG: 1,4-alpha-glucan branching protein GlgB [Bryobacteraceae bacterium]|nr:1,4-alpha-glucan branching protein GlgB [Bryobacteraceae bacterium]
MTKPRVEQLIAGTNGDPFSILGPHLDGDHWAVRVFAPGASRVDVLVDGLARPAELLDPAGFFCARLEDHPEDYRLRIDGGDPVADPYRFPPLISEFDLHLFGEGTHYAAYNFLGAHLCECEGVGGVCFAVWAPNADAVQVIGDFNDWSPTRHPMRLRNAGVWELFLPGLGEGAQYKYRISARGGASLDKADPYAVYCQRPPATASIVSDLGRYEWSDQEWMTRRAERNWLEAPLSIYEVHLESWMHKDGEKPLTYRELARTLVDYVLEMGYTHIELMPILEHPYSGSWGYQVTGFFAPTSRFGAPDDFRYFVDACHRAGIGVLLDWVPGHFPKDAHGLGYFDGTALYEHEDPRQGEHRDWGTLIFNYGRNEVQCLLLSSATLWFEQYHLDGMRVDAVASMIYLDFGRDPGDWIPNRYGGSENLEAIAFLRRFNELAHGFPGVITIAEESTDFPGVSKPVYLNGLGFTMKWNMGWMHDMFAYFKRDPVYRKYHQNHVTFSLWYAFNENYVLPISHDEVVHLKKSLLSKMPGDEWQRFANVRAFLGYMFTHPGKKLLFMGCDLGMYEEWNWQGQLPWYLLQYDYHRKLHAYVRELNRLVRREPALHEVDFESAGFQWIDFRDLEMSTLSFLRFARDREDFLVIVCNFTPVPRSGYRVGVPRPGKYLEIFNSDSEMFHGSNMGNSGLAVADAIWAHERPFSMPITLPPFGVVVFKPEPLPKPPRIEAAAAELPVALDLELEVLKEELTGEEAEELIAEPEV